MDYPKEGTPSMGEVKTRVREDLGMIRNAVERRRHEILDDVLDYVDGHPLAAVGAAFGAGYLLSGALLSRMSFRILGFGTRLVVGNAVRQALAGGLGLPGSLDGEEPNVPSSATPRS